MNELNHSAVDFFLVGLQKTIIKLGFMWTFLSAFLCEDGEG